MKTNTFADLVNAARELDTDESGAGATEYIIIVALIAIALIAIITAFGQSLFDIFSGSRDRLDTDVQGQDFGN